MQEIAQNIRSDFETGSLSRELLFELYRHYAHVGDTLKFIHKAIEIFPIGNCGLTSLYLKNKLGGEIIQGKCGKQNHTFLLHKDMVIDITADQFGGPEVYVGPLRSPWSF